MQLGARRADRDGHRAAMVRLECTAPNASTRIGGNEPGRLVRFATVVIEGRRHHVSEALDEGVAAHFLQTPQCFRIHHGPVDLVDAELERQERVQPPPAAKAVKWGLQEKRLTKQAAAALAACDDAAYFAAQVQLGEAQLVQSRRPVGIWKALKPYTAGGRVVAFGGKEVTYRALGPMAPRRREAVFDTREVVALGPLNRKVRSCPKCAPRLAGLSGEVLQQNLIGLAKGHHPREFAAYEEELEREVDFEGFADAPAHRAAQRAAVAAMALGHLDDEETVRAAKEFLKGLDRQERILARTSALGRRAKDQGRQGAEEQRRKKSLKGGATKKGKVLTHKRVIRAAVAYLKARSRAVSDAAVRSLLLRREVPDEVLEAAEPDTLCAWDPQRRRPIVADDENGTLVFNFVNRPSKAVSMRRLADIVREADRDSTIPGARPGYERRADERTRETGPGGQGSPEAQRGRS